MSHPPLELVAAVVVIAFILTVVANVVAWARERWGESEVPGDD